MTERKEYYKLIRDRIPDIIKRQGRQCTVRQPESEEELRLLLKAKMLEELDELWESPSAEEAADILEVLRATCTYFNINWRQVMTARMEKNERRGGFEQPTSAAGGRRSSRQQRNGVGGSRKAGVPRDAAATPTPSLPVHSGARTTQLAGRHKHAASALQPASPGLVQG